MEQSEVNAEVFRIIRAAGERENAKVVRGRIDTHLKGHATQDQIRAGIKWLYEKMK